MAGDDAERAVDPQPRRRRRGGGALRPRPQRAHRRDRRRQVHRGRRAPAPHRRPRPARPDPHRRRHRAGPRRSSRSTRPARWPRCSTRPGTAPRRRRARHQARARAHPADTASSSTTRPPPWACSSAWASSWSSCTASTSTSACWSRRGSSLLLDRFAGARRAPRAAGRAGARWEEARAALLRLREEMREGARQEDLYRFQLSEIDGAAASRTARRTSSGPSAAASSTPSGSRPACRRRSACSTRTAQSAAARLARAAALLRDARAIEPDAAAPARGARGAPQAYVEDAVGRARALRDRAVFDPERLERDRRAARRHRQAQAEVRRDRWPPSLAYRHEVAAALDRLTRHDAIVAETASARWPSAAAAAGARGRALSEARTEAPSGSSGSIQKELRGLGMEHAPLPRRPPARAGRPRASSRRATGGWRRRAARGRDRRAPALGQPRRGACGRSPRSSRAASCRATMLAVKTILAAADDVPVAGLRRGGRGHRRPRGRRGRPEAPRTSARAARCSASPTWRRSRPTPASTCVVEKRVARGATRTSVTAARRGAARVEELARMLGGERVTDTSRRHARELLARRPRCGAGWCKMRPVTCFERHLPRDLRHQARARRQAHAPGRRRDQRARARAAGRSPTRPSAPGPTSSASGSPTGPSSTICSPRPSPRAARRRGAPCACGTSTSSSWAAWCCTRARSRRWRPARARPSWPRCPPYLNALPGLGTHVVTVNDYLARRDAQWMGPIYHALGLSVGRDPARDAVPLRSRPTSRSDIRLAALRPCSRREAYRADITYGTNNEFGFDYLRDNMRFSLEDIVQREHHYAIVDEVDSILIDEARTPLIISGRDRERRAGPRSTRRSTGSSRGSRAPPPSWRASSPRSRSQPRATSSWTRRRAPSRSPSRAWPTASGSSASRTSPTRPTWRLLHHIHQALKAHHIFQKDVDYVVKDMETVDDRAGACSSPRSSSSTSSPAA